MHFSDLPALLLGLTILIVAAAARALPRMLKEKALSDELCRRLGCKALPVRFWTGGIRLVLERARYCGLMKLDWNGFDLYFEGMMSHASPVVCVFSHGTEAALTRFVLPLSTVSAGGASFQERFMVYARSSADAEALLPPRLQEAIVRLEADLHRERELPVPTGFVSLVRIVMSNVQWHRRSSEPSHERPFKLGVYGNSVGLVFAAREPSILDALPRIVTLLDALVAASSTLQHKVDEGECRFCSDTVGQPPKRACERCGASYHESCFDMRRCCPVWGCGDRKEQLQAFCDSEGWISPGGYYRWRLRLPSGESPRSPDD